MLQEELLSSLLTSLPPPSSIQQESVANIRERYLTLQALYPEHLIPALDLLDRNMVEFLYHEDQGVEVGAYYVRSTKDKPTSRRRNANYSAERLHEIRISAWTCSCAAFAFAVFPSLEPAGHDVSDHRMQPMCKHLLACLFIDRGKGAGWEKSYQRRRVSLEELAGLAAG
ncbi:hypothetical protein K470DRAFT_215566 [Piedraia hortae CBS 480.64]|uniref:SWIM-type domain-containing protein n=1 Tax=Piedraia hortae CBS 480.64 TaxID=1314780 RepID=A0A6A7C0S9_9PEZI|nr:hypothetical protein K470DRAFT_215566 [Piedraia hortae CBS 480.64]